MPGGHVEDWEDIHEALIRELFEELELTVSFFEVGVEEILHHQGKKMNHLALPVTSYVLNYKDAEWKDRSRVEYIFLMTSDGDVGKIQTEEIDEYKWFDIDEILGMKPNIDTWDFYQQILEKIFGDWEDEDT